MFDQENPKGRRVVPRETPSGPPAPLVLMSEKEMWRHQLKESSLIRAAHGFGMKDKRLIIVDKEKLSRTDPHLKSIFRELYEEMK